MYLSLMVERTLKSNLPYVSLCLCLSQDGARASDRLHPIIELDQPRVDTCVGMRNVILHFIQFDDSSFSSPFASSDRTLEKCTAIGYKVRLIYQLLHWSMRRIRRTSPPTTITPLLLKRRDPDGSDV